MTWLPRDIGMLKRVLSEIEPGHVRLVLAGDPARVFGQIETLAAAKADGDQDTSQFVGCVWESLPTVSQLIPDVLDALAETALACWPNWYATSPRQRFETRPSSIRKPSDLLCVETLRNARVPALEPWLRAAMVCCEADQPPRPTGFADAVQAAQLGLAIDPARLILLLATTEAEQPVERLDGLARAAEWLARATEASVAVVVPASLAGNAALDSISFDALRSEDEIQDSTPRLTAENGRRTDVLSNAARQRTGGPLCQSEDSADAPTSTSFAPQHLQPERSRVFVWPLQGVPHPRSEGEQLLARRLRQDDELGPLFEFNQSVATSRESLHTVDLLWRVGRVVVEIDGYRWHSSREMFARDRHRDYELMISEFLVLRLTHSEVVRDVELAIEKIRDVVRLRRGAS